MENHTYKWNGKVYLKSEGGGIGDKLAQAAARLVMIWFDDQFLNLLAKANIEVSLYKRYVDDGNLKLPAIDEELAWDKESNSLKNIANPSVSSDQPDKRTALIIKDIADSVTDMLRWTADYPSAHSNGRLPILDIETWCIETPKGTVAN